MVRVLVVVANRIYREHLVELLSRAGFAVAGAVAAVDEVLGQADVSSVDVGLVDISAGGSLGALRSLASALPQLKVVAAGLHHDVPLKALAESGVNSFLFLNASQGELLATLSAAAPPGERAAGGSIEQRTEVMAHTLVRGPASLTRREREIIELIDEGRSDKEIATRLGVELHTVKNHVHNVLTKLQLRRRGEAAAWLRRRR